MDFDMEVYLLRHGKSVANEQKLVCGCLDVPLSEIGYQQAERICEHLDRINFTRIYSSALSRARNTVSSLKCAVKVSVEPDLIELNTGDFSFLKLEELWEQDPRYKRPWLIPDLYYPKGERFIDMVTRIRSWYRAESQSWHDDEKILIVGHEGTIRNIYSDIFNLKIDDYPDFPIGNCDYMYFDLRENEVFKYELVKYNDLVGGKS